jgi:soluble lytic murein transglycosylase-like protein
MRFLGILLLLATASTCLAGEFAILATGGRLRVDRHEPDGNKVRLYSGAGYIELDCSQISSFEAIEDAAPPPTAPAVQPVAPPIAQPTPLELADAAADRYGLPRGLVRSVMSAESANRPNAVSPKGAIGLMQLMPATAKALGVDPHDPAQNVDAGTRYLRDLLLLYDYRLWHALAAYNAGAGAVQKYKGIPPYRETVNYVNRIDRAYRKTTQIEPGS